MKKPLAIFLVVLMLCPAFMLASCGYNDVAPFDKDASVAKLDALGEKDGYEIEYTLTDENGRENKILLARKGDTGWRVSERDGRKEGEAFVQLPDNTYDGYAFDGEEWSFAYKTVQSEPADVNSFLTLAAQDDANLYYANDFEDKLTSEGSAEIAGRRCEKFTCGTENSDSFAVAYIDKELGITVKWESGAENGNVLLEITSVKTGKDVEIPGLPEAGEDYQDSRGVLGWTDNSFTKLIPKAPGKVQYSNISDGRLGVLLKDVTADDFEAYFKALTDAGFEGETEDGIFCGEDSAGNVIIVDFDSDDGEMIIQLAKAK